MFAKFACHQPGTWRQSVTALERPLNASDVIGCLLSPFDIPIAQGFIASGQMTHAIGALERGNAETRAQFKKCEGATASVACFEANDRHNAQILYAFADSVSQINNLDIDPTIIHKAEKNARALAMLFQKSADAGPTSTDLDRAVNQAHFDHVQSQYNASIHALINTFNNAFR